MKQIDLSNPKRNMFGIRDCPECGSKHRWPTQPIHPKHPDCIICDQCGRVEPIIKIMTFVDQDGDSLEVREVGGFGQPMLVVTVEQDGGECAMNLTIPQATELRDYLTTHFIERKRND